MIRHRFLAVSVSRSPPLCVNGPLPLTAQVLDDSTRDDIKRRVDIAAARMVEEGYPVQVWG